MQTVKISMFIVATGAGKTGHGRQGSKIQGKAKAQDGRRGQGWAEFSYPEVEQKRGWGI
jgi:hypothetical protein